MVVLKGLSLSHELHFSMVSACNRGNTLTCMVLKGLSLDLYLMVLKGLSLSPELSFSVVSASRINTFHKADMNGIERVKSLT